MTGNELSRFRAVLTARVAEMERRMGQRDGIAVEKSADQLDEIQAASERTLAVCNLDREFNELRDARAALHRLQEGTFGTCQECDQDIHPKRLAAVPWAPLCIQCQEAADSYRRDGKGWDFRDQQRAHPVRSETGAKEQGPLDTEFRQLLRQASVIRHSVYQNPLDSLGNRNASNSSV